jgi:hypothetical protein
LVHTAKGKTRKKHKPAKCNLSEGGVTLCFKKLACSVEQTLFVSSLVVSEFTLDIMLSQVALPDPSKQKLKICILQSDYASTNSVFKDVDPYAQPERWLKDHDCHSAFIKKASAMQQIRDLAKDNYDVYVNLCDGAWDEERAGIAVVQALDR